MNLITVRSPLPSLSTLAHTPPSSSQKSVNFPLQVEQISHKTPPVQGFGEQLFSHSDYSDVTFVVQPTAESPPVYIFSNKLVLTSGSSYFSTCASAFTSSASHRAGSPPR